MSDSAPLQAEQSAGPFASMLDAGRIRSVAPEAAEFVNASTCGCGETFSVKLEALEKKKERQLRTT